MNKKIHLPKRILKDDEPILRKYSKTVSFPLDKDDLDIIQQLKNYLKISNDISANKIYNLAPAVGISAVQIGYLKKIVAINFKNNNINYEYILINPRIISHNNQKVYLENGEGCLSVSNPYDNPIYRYDQIVLKAFDIKNKEIILELNGFASIVIQHELDHLMGILYTDYISGVVNNDPGVNPKPIRT